jgi:hypothetical protein
LVHRNLASETIRCAIKPQDTWNGLGEAIITGHLAQDLELAARLSDVDG